MYLKCGKNCLIMPKMSVSEFCKLSSPLSRKMYMIITNYSMLVIIDLINFSCIPIKYTPFLNSSLHGKRKKIIF